ncbi:fungal-specific transcription factor domain-containing protein [Truncatella angustata]|uniref:Fungal-specific transcription factor domain-containing protein n=1 Tax=Truncatella angustata TaxID=152316 RepID=A0A9P8UA43_9PEZI|nr:fungal-specific transcription factor domain-containing protein [Truncatella angustata]KAH6638674.1 fungal-specific transcription factor domain-containing protein [Truncatella angustata]
MDRASPRPPPTQNSGSKVRRPRAARACDACRIKKNKCDDLYPCTYCRNHNIECVYRGQDSGRRLFTPDYVRHLEEEVKRLAALQAQVKNGQSVTYTTPLTDEPSATTPTYRDADRHPSSNYDAESPASTRLRPGAGQEVSGVNRHTRNVEFYGSSSSVAILSQVQRAGGAGDAPEESPEDHDGEALVSNLHNHAFSPAVDAALGGHRPGRVTHYPQCRNFILNYFTSIHFVHPFLDKAEFLSRCEKLWSQEGDPLHTSSFAALYYSMLSLGALVGPREEEPIGGVSNLQWSRTFFDEAISRCHRLGMVTDLDMVQCYFMLSKICQNELNAHWSYMYVGLAVRTALAMGINREPPPESRKPLSQLKAEARTWWGLYSLETEMSFAMGRPDTLGSDLYHNRSFPLIGNENSGSSSHDRFEPPQCAIIKSMVDLSRITRSICFDIYLPETITPRTIAVAYRLEQDLDKWVESLPMAIRPKQSMGEPVSLKSVRDPQWAKRQRLVLGIRYHNLRILTFGSLLLTSSSNERSTLPGIREGIQKCLDSAKQTIDTIYVTYQHHDFFRTWYYNTTYTVFAASVILVYVMKEATETETEPLLKVVAMAIEILETMDECVVALKAAKLMQKSIDKARRKFSTETPPTVAPTVDANEAMIHLNHYWGPLNLIDGEMDFDFAFQLEDMDGTNSMFAPL